MTDETYEEIAAFVKANAIPKTDVFAAGFPVDVKIDEELLVGDVQILGDCRKDEWGTRPELRVSNADFADLRQRLAEEAHREDLDRALREALGQEED